MQIEDNFYCCCFTNTTKEEALNFNRNFCENILFSAYNEQGKCNYCKQISCNTCNAVKKLETQFDKKVFSHQTKMLKDGFSLKNTKK